MKKRSWIALLLVPALMLPLSGCGVLDRSHLSVETHSESPEKEQNSSILRAESYHELVEDILYFVQNREETGTVRFVDYSGDVDEDLDNACREVYEQDPLGSYAVDYIKYETTSVVSYQEATFTIGYRRTLQQINSITNVTGTSAIRAEISTALAQFDEETVMRVSYFSGTTEDITQLIRDAYYETPLAAFGYPSATVTLYPDSGTQRIVEIILSYPESHAALVEKATATMSAANTLLSSLGSSDAEKLWEALAVLLKQNTDYLPEGGSSAWSALTEGAADSEGLALAYELLCQQESISVYVVPGTLNGEQHFWNIVATADGFRHLDLSAGVAAHSDAEMASAGYSWDTQAFPACGDPIEIAEPPASENSVSASLESAASIAVP